jgi:hypothetical protein
MAEAMIAVPIQFSDASDFIHMSTAHPLRPLR